MYEPSGKTNMEVNVIAGSLGALTADIRAVNIEKGWRAPDGGLCPGQTFGDYIALLHSEASEALEAYRDHRLADATERRVMPVKHCPRCGEPGAGFVNGSAFCNRCDWQGLPKPEGVGSEFADMLIRLLDMCDVFGIRVSGYDRLSLIRDHVPDTRLTVDTFGDHIAWLHYEISIALISPARLAMVLRTLVTIARTYGIDLAGETQRKIAYNRTRSFQHGGRTLADPEVRHFGDDLMTPICEDWDLKRDGVTVVVADSDRVNCQACNQMIQEKG